MAKLRHLAISVKDPEKAVKFFVDAFEMKACGRFETPRSEGCYVTDGYMLVALINFKTPEALGEEFDAGFEGLHHIGFKVDDMAEAGRRIVAAGYEPRDGMNKGRPRELEAHEFKYAGPGGITVDVSKGGWDNVAALFPELNAEFLASK
jgi:catechol 2,3-dioxygenase-like lactoylglutathione lyase family enzyme